MFNIILNFISESNFECLHVFELELMLVDVEKKNNDFSDNNYSISFYKYTELSELNRVHTRR